MTRRLSSYAALLSSVALGAQAQLDDPLTTADNFAEPFGPVAVQASAEEEGHVTLTREAGEDDAGVDWLIDGKTDLPLDADHDHLTITPRAPVDGGYYVASLLFFGPDDEFIAEKIWIEDTDLPTPQTLPSVKEFAAKNEVDDATKYRLRIRVNPVGQPDAGFVFSHIAAVNIADVEPE